MLTEKYQILFHTKTEAYFFKDIDIVSPTPKNVEFLYMENVCDLARSGISNPLVDDSASHQLPLTVQEKDSWMINSWSGKERWNCVRPS